MKLKWYKDGEEHIGKAWLGFYNSELGKEVRGKRNCSYQEVYEQALYDCFVAGFRSSFAKGFSIEYGKITDSDRKRLEAYVRENRVGGKSSRK